jgi:two-component system chemotaxis response regulator CheY
MAYDFSNLSAYVIDANNFSRQILRGLIGAIGVPHAAIKEMADAEAALVEIQHFPPDFILCDINLPGMSGIDFIRAVRRLEDEATRYTPIIVCTAYTEQWRVVEYRDAGAHEVLHKPISVQTLYLRLASVIESPRSFIYTPDFSGPDRRRRLEGPGGDERRSSKPPDA